MFRICLSYGELELIRILKVLGKKSCHDNTVSVFWTSKVMGGKLYMDFDQNGGAISQLSIWCYL